MKNKFQNLILGGIIISVLIVFGYLIITNKNALKNKEEGGSASVSGSSLVVLENNFDFKTISMGAGKMSHNFEIQNSGNEPVVISKIYTSCMCTAANLINKGKQLGPFGMSGHSAISKINEVVNPGEKATIKAVFDPAAHGPEGVGLAKRVIYIETNSSVNPVLELVFEANVVL